MIYVKNRDLLEQIIISKDASALTKEAIDMFILMSERFGTKMQYLNPMDRDDCKAQAIMDCYLYWHNFNPDKSSNAFAYFTQIIKNGYAKGWRKLHKIPVAKQISISEKLYNL